MSTQNTQGIQALLEAEKEAAKIVAKARQYRLQKLKDAKVEAQKEIDLLKQQKEREYQQYVQSNAETDSLDKVTKEVEQRLQELRVSFTQKQQEVMQKLLDTVCRVEPQIHRNMKLKQ